MYCERVLQLVVVCKTHTHSLLLNEMLPTGIAILARVSFLAFITVVQSANIDCTGIKAVDPRCKSDEVGMIRDFFYIGGEYVYEPDYSSSIYSGQMYVEKLRPLCGPKRKHPIVFISAGIPSGVVRVLYNNGVVHSLNGRILPIGQHTYLRSFRHG